MLLKDVLISPHIIKNLISFCKFTSNNYVSLTFDQFGFPIKDLNSGSLIQRCDSVGDLYLVLPSSIPSVVAHVLSTVSLPTWYHRLGHPDSFILKYFTVLQVHIHHIYQRSYFSCLLTWKT